MLVSNRGVFLSRKALVYGLKRYNCTGISVKKIILALSQMELLDEDRGGTHTTKVQNVRAYCILYNELKERYEELEVQRNKTAVGNIRSGNYILSF